MARPTRGGRSSSSTARGGPGERGQRGKVTDTWRRQRSGDTASLVEKRHTEKHPLATGETAPERRRRASAERGPRSRLRRRWPAAREGTKPRGPRRVCTCASRPRVSGDSLPLPFGCLDAHEAGKREKNNNFQHKVSVSHRHTHRENPPFIYISKGRQDPDVKRRRKKIETAYDDRARPEHAVSCRLAVTKSETETKPSADGRPRRARWPSPARRLPEGRCRGGGRPPRRTQAPCGSHGPADLSHAEVRAPPYLCLPPTGDSLLLMAVGV